MHPIPALLLMCFLVSAPALAAAEAFPRPQALEPNIQFWTRVYTEVDNQGGYIHDDRRLDVVYAVVRFPPNSTRRQRQRVVTAAKRLYREALLALAAGKRRDLTEAEAKALSLWPRDVSEDTLRRAAERLRFQRGQADRFRQGLQRAGAWEGYIRKTLRDMNLPEDIAALPHVESSYNAAARSKAGAAGMWQFTRSTGRRFLRIDHVVDERMDPYKAAVAAARLLQYNYDALGSWPLAITAYNHGLAGMRRAVQRLGTTDIADIVQRYDGRLFGFASRNFYAAFLAARAVAADAEKHFGRLGRHQPPRQSMVTLPAYLATDALAKALGVSLSELRRLNPALQASVWKGDKFVPRGYELRLPGAPDQADRHAIVLTLAQREGAEQQTLDRYYRVQRGDSLWTIARRYKTSVAELAAHNLLTSRHRIRAGQTLRLPVPGESSPPTPVAAAGPEPAPPAPAPADGHYQVKSGDTLSGIAQRFGLDAGDLAAANGIGNPRRLSLGQRLQLAYADASLPGARAPVTSDVSADVGLHRLEVAVEPGEAEASAGILATEPQPDLAADPADYSVAEDGSIEIQAEETLGHYAEWLGLRASDLRRVNRLRYGRPLVIGHRLKLEFSQVDAKTFERLREDYHRALQAAFFAEYHIAGTCQHRMRSGDSLWRLAKVTFDLPLWLLRQYNPDLDFGSLRPGILLTVPRLQRQEGNTGPVVAKRGAGAPAC